MCHRSHEFVHWPTSNPSLTNSGSILLPAATSRTCASNSVASSTTPARPKSKNLRFQMIANTYIPDPRTCVSANERMLQLPHII